MSKGKTVIKSLLEKMIECVERGDKAGMQKLNEVYTRKSARLYHKPMTSIELEYDAQESALVASFGVNKDMREETIRYVNQRLKELPPL